MQELTAEQMQLVRAERARRMREWRKSQTPEQKRERRLRYDLNAALKRQSTQQPERRKQKTGKTISK